MIPGPTVGLGHCPPTTLFSPKKESPKPNLRTDAGLEGEQPLMTFEESTEKI